MTYADAAHHCVVEEKGDKKNLVKIPYDDDFNFLYYQRVYNGNNLSRTQAFYYCGLYNKLDGKLYDLQSVLKGKLPELDSGKTIRTIQDEFESAVRCFINDIVDNNVDNLRSPFFENAITWITFAVRSLKMKAISKNWIISKNITLKR